MPLSLAVNLNARLAVVLWAAAALAFSSFAMAGGEAERRLAAELVVISGDLRMLASADLADPQRQGLLERISGGLAPLPLLLRAARAENPRLPITPAESIARIRAELAAGSLIAARDSVQALVRRYPLRLVGILPTDERAPALASAQQLHAVFCAGCHDASVQGSPNPATERPAWNLFQMARRMEPEEFAARLLTGVRGESLTAMDNPLTDAEMSALIGFYRRHNAGK